MMPTTSTAAEIFAANRAAGRIALSVNHACGATRPARVHEAGMLRVRFPNGERHDTLEAVIVNTAGGFAGGDQAEIEIKAAEQSQVMVTSAAAEKVYRSLGPDTEISIRLEAGSGAGIAWLPQETILFDRMRLRRSIDVALTGDARLLIAEAIVFGRSAMGERLTSGSLFDRWRVRIDGALVFADGVHLDGEIAKSLAQRAVAGEGVAVATLLKSPGNDDAVATLRAIASDFSGEVGVSAWNGLLVGRLVAPTSAALRHDMIRILAALGTPLPRLWLN